jgi:15-cis-phytoene synthase
VRGAGDVVAQRGGGGAALSGAEGGAVARGGGGASSGAEGDAVASGDGAMSAAEGAGAGLVAGGVVRARAALAAGSRSFALAGKLLPRGCRDDAAVVYAFCRWADDLVDHAPPGQVAAAVARLQGEVAALFAGAALRDPVLAAFQEVARRRDIPRWLVDELIAGFAMDARPLPIVYGTWRELLLYCFRVAGTVGLMMCRVMGTRDPRSARHAAALGMAMQLTNIARDVAEDWDRGRRYIPAEALQGALPEAPGAVPLGVAGSRGRAAPLPRAGSPGHDGSPGCTLPSLPAAGPLGHDGSRGRAAPLQLPAGPLGSAAPAGLARAVASLLAAAERFYRWGDAGLPALDARAAIATRTARLVYSAIGDRLAERGCDVTAPRAVVSRAQKLRLLVRAGLEVARDRLFRARRVAAALPPLPGPLPLPFLRLPEPLP